MNTFTRIPIFSEITFKEKQQKLRVNEDVIGTLIPTGNFQIFAFLRFYNQINLYILHFLLAT